MKATRRHVLARAGVGALVVLSLVACGGDGGSGSAQSPTSTAAPTQPSATQPPAPPPEAAPPPSAIPDITVRDVASGAEFALGSLVPSDRPLLVWFWAPS